MYVIEKATNEVKTAEVEIALEDNKEVDLIVFDDKECLDDKTEEYSQNLDEEVKVIFDDDKNAPSGADDSVISLEHSESLEVADKLDNDEEAFIKSLNKTTLAARSCST